MKEKTNLIHLRGHHLLCLQGYQGYGYDEKFKANMENIIAKLNSNENYKVILTDSADDLCKCCPNLKNNKCIEDINNLEDSNIYQNKIEISNNKIINMDNNVIKKVKLKKDKEYSFKKLIFLVNKVFYSIHEAKEICANCEWTNKCLWIQSRKQ